jgi:hypothetical protein
VTRPAPSLEDQRRATLAELEKLLGTQAIGAEEYRSRAEVARHARDEAELATVRPAALQRAAPKHPTPATPAALDNPTGFAVAFMGGSLRNGQWEPPDTLYALAFMGGVELDFREAALLEGTTDVVALALMGGIKITVPDDIDVEVNGFGFMGGFEHVSRHEPGGERPLLRIRGVAIMGGVSVKVKPAPGSTPGKRLAKRMRQLV